MPGITAAVSVALFAALSAFVLRRFRELAGEVRELGDRVRELSIRLQVAERDATVALGQADVAESVLLEKGVADEEDLEAARARSGGGDPGHLRGRAGEVH